METRQTFYVPGQGLNREFKRLMQDFYYFSGQLCPERSEEHTVRFIKHYRYPVKKCTDFR